MGKCITCGRHGILLKIMPSGMCKDCEEKKREEDRRNWEKAKQEERDRILKEHEDKKKIEKIFFHEVAEKLNNIKDEDDVLECLGSNAIEKDQNRKKVDEIIAEYSSFINQIKEHVKNPLFKEVIAENISQDKGPYSSSSFGKISEWNVSVYYDSIKRSYDIDRAVSSVISDFESAIRSYIGIYKKLNNFVAFEKMIDAIPEYIPKEDVLTAEKAEQIDLGRIKLSQITAKDFYDNLGFFVSISMSDSIVGAVIYENWHPQSKIKVNLSEDGMRKLSSYIGNRNVIGKDLITTVSRINSVNATFLSKKRKYYDAVLLCRKMMESKKWMAEHHVISVCNINFESLCDYYEIRDNNTIDQSISDCCAIAGLFELVCKYRSI